MENEEYFSQTKREYADAIDYSTQNAPEYARALADKLNSLLHGHVADIGNGGTIFYDSDGLDSLLCVDIANPKLESKQGNKLFVYGDFYEFEFPHDLDCALTQYLLHHLCDDDRLTKALRKLSRTLAPEGRLIIVETLMPRHIEILQMLFGPALNALLGMIKRPSLRFFSQSSLSSLLTKAGFGSVTSHGIDVDGWVAPAPVLFPSLKMPGWLYPLKVVVIEARTGTPSPADAC